MWGCTSLYLSWSLNQPRKAVFMLDLEREARIFCVLAIIFSVSAQLWDAYEVIKEPEYFQYSIDCSTTDLADSSEPNTPRTYQFTRGGKDTEMTCAKVLTKEYLNPYIMTAEVFVKPKNYVRTGDVPLVPDSKTMPLERIKDCCGSQECQGCFSSNIRCVARIWHPNDFKNQKRMFWKGLCHLCLQVDCVNTCPNGKFAPAYMTRDKVNHMMDTSLQCRDCEPGTFNTCVFADTCSW